MKSKEYQALSTHPVFRPVTAGNYARLFTEQPFDFVNPAAQVDATRPALTPYFDSAYQALLSQSPAALFLQAQQSAHKPESIVTLLICAEMHSRHSLDSNGVKKALTEVQQDLDDLEQAFGTSHFLEPTATLLTPCCQQASSIKPSSEARHGDRQ